MAQAALDKATNKLSQVPIKEGEFTKKLESQTAKLPSSGFLILAIGSMVLSASLAIFSRGESKWPNFVGLWAPSFLLIGIYNKLVKIEGSDRYSQSQQDLERTGTSGIQSPASEASSSI